MYGYCNQTFSGSFNHCLQNTPWETSINKNGVLGYCIHIYIYIYYRMSKNTYCSEKAGYPRTEINSPCGEMLFVYHPTMRYFLKFILFKL